jgi:tetratricopeptide (TPR) repeat protein
MPRAEGLGGARPDRARACWDGSQPLSCERRQQAGERRGGGLAGDGGPGRARLARARQEAGGGGATQLARGRVRPPASGSSAPAPRAITGTFALLLLLCAAGAARAQAEFERGLELFEAGAYAEAELAFKAAERANPDDARAPYHAGLAASKQDDPARAIEAFQRAAELDPDLPNLQSNIGVAYYELGDLENAATHLERAEVLDPSDGSAPYFLGLIDYRYARYESAIAHFEGSAAADPTYAARAWYGIGRAQQELGNEALAEESFRRAVELDEDGTIADDVEALLAPTEFADTHRKRWSLRAGAGFLGDSNVIVDELDLNADQGDIGGSFDIGIDLLVFERGATEVEIGYDFYQSLYEDLEGFNRRIHAPYVALKTGLGGFEPSLAYRFAHTKLGGDGFLDMHTAAFGLGRQLTSWWYGLAAYDLEGLAYEEETGRDATRNAFRVDQSFVSSDELFSAFIGWRIERNDAQDGEFDYRGNTLRAELEVPSPIGRDEARLEFGYEFRARAYDDPTPISVDGRGTGGEDREDRRHSGWVELTLPFVKHLDAVVRFTQIGSISNLPRQDFDESIIDCRFELWF